MTDAYSLIGLSLMHCSGTDHSSQVQSLMHNLSERLDQFDQEQLTTVTNLLLAMVAVKTEQTPKELLSTLWEAVPSDDEWNEEWLPGIQQKMGRTQN